MLNLKEIPETRNGQDISWKSVLKNGNLDSMYQEDRFVNSNRLFYSMNGTLPNKKIFRNVDKPTVFEKLVKEYHLSKEKIIEVKFYDLKKNRNRLQNKELEIKEWGSTLLLIMPELFVYFDPSTGRLDILYGAEVSEDSLDNLIEIICSCPEENEVNNKVHIMIQNSDGLRLDHIEIEPYKIDLQRNYEDDFLQIHETIIERLHKEKDKGLVLLHGKPGTGKTTYLRHLISQTTKRVIYVSPDFAEMIASPTFMGLLINYPDSILVIEDAENIIEQRKGGNSVAVSNLLNISDGLLSDCLNIQLVCSFNNDINRIDSALLRKGRLIAKYEFKELSIVKGQALSDSSGFKTIIEKEMTLADIYNQSDEDFSRKGERKVIGF